MYYVYILKTLGKKRFYVGTTKNLERRLSEHAQGKVRSTAKLFVRLIYKEACSGKTEAMLREQWLKSGVGRKWIEENLL